MAWMFTTSDHSLWWVSGDWEEKKQAGLTVPRASVLQIVVEKIRVSPAEFDTSPETLKSLTGDPGYGARVKNSWRIGCMYNSRRYEKRP